MIISERRERLKRAQHLSDSVASAVAMRMRVDFVVLVRLFGLITDG